MFTIKAYADGFITRILEADSFTILDGPNGTREITLHRDSGEDVRIDVCQKPSGPDRFPYYQKAIIENAAGKTTEIIHPYSSAVPLPSPAIAA